MTRIPITLLTPVLLALLASVMLGGCMSNAHLHEARCDASRVANYMAGMILERYDTTAEQPYRSHDEGAFLSQLSRRDRFVLEQLMAMNSAELDLTVQAWAKLYWEPKARHRLGGEWKLRITHQLAAVMTDKSYEELVRIALYSRNETDVAEALNYCILTRRGVAAGPSYAAIAERTDMPESIRWKARRAYAFSMGAPAVQEVLDTLYSKEMSALPAKGSERAGLCHDIEKELVDAYVALQDKVMPEKWNARTLVLHKSRGDAAPSPVVKPYGGGNGDEVVVLRALRSRLREVEREHETHIFATPD